MCTFIHPAKDEKSCFFTIGYQGKSLENYLYCLMENNIKALCDVRKNPISRKHGFSKRQLEKAVNDIGIELCTCLNLELPLKKRCNLKTREDYEHLFEDYRNTTLKDNLHAIEKLYQLFLDKKRVAITCFETDVCMCHRGEITKALTQLKDWKYEIKHI